MSSMNDSSSSDMLHGWKPLKITTAIIYPLIILLSTVGNSIVIITVIRAPSMRTITNLFIVNLAVSDLLMTFVSASFTPIAFYMKNWNLPQAMCYLLPMTMAISLYVSTLTSTAIAVDRYLVTVHPFVRRMSFFVCSIIIASAWLFSIVVTCPLAIYQQIKIDSKTDEVKCIQSWPGKMSQTAFTVITFLLQFVFPCILVSICYYRVSCILKTRCDVRIGMGQKNRVKEENEIRRKRRTNKMLIAMVVIFVICWIPLHVLWIAVDVIEADVDNSEDLGLAFIWCHMIAMSSTVYNPFLYAWLNNNFRQEFKAILQCANSRYGQFMQSRNCAPHVSVTYVPPRPGNHITVQECVTNALNPIPMESEFREAVRRASSGPPSKEVIQLEDRGETNNHVDGK